MDMRRRLTREIMKFILTLILGCSCVLVALFLFLLNTKEVEKKWNNGICSCGGNWEFVNADYAGFGQYLYFYECDDCGELLKSRVHYKQDSNKGEY